MGSVQPGDEQEGQAGECQSRDSLWKTASPDSTRLDELTRRHTAGIYLITNPGGSCGGGNHSLCATARCTPSILTGPSR